MRNKKIVYFVSKAEKEHLEAEEMRKGEKEKNE